MHTIRKALALAVVASTLSAGVLFAQDHHDDHHDDRRDDHRQDGDHHQNPPYVHHQEWKRGYHMNHDDWNRGERIDYRRYHLRTPPRGYEWREVDGNYVLGAVATGIIASAIIASSNR